MTALINNQIFFYLNLINKAQGQLELKHQAVTFIFLTLFTNIFPQSH